MKTFLVVIYVSVYLASGDTTKPEALKLDGQGQNMTVFSQEYSSRDVCRASARGMANSALRAKFESLPPQPPGKKYIAGYGVRCLLSEEVHGLGSPL